RRLHASGSPGRRDAQRPPVRRGEAARACVRLPAGHEAQSRPPAAEGVSVRSACRVALAGALLSLTVPAASPAADAGHWVAAWSASPSDASPVTPALSDETLRMIIHPTFGGTRVRLRLSNRFGSSPRHAGGGDHRAASVGRGGGARNVASGHLPG